jgi:hypothetical protein
VPYQEDGIEAPDLLRVDPESEREQLDRPKASPGLKDRCSMGEACAAMPDMSAPMRQRSRV